MFSNIFEQRLPRHFYNHQRANTLFVVTNKQVKNKTPLVPNQMNYG